MRYLINGVVNTIVVIDYLCPLKFSFYIHHRSTLENSNQFSCSIHSTHTFTEYNFSPFTKRQSPKLKCNDDTRHSLLNSIQMILHVSFNKHKIFVRTQLVYEIQNVVWRSQICLFCKFN